MFSRAVKTLSLRATAALYSWRKSARVMRGSFGIAGRFSASRSLANSLSQVLKTAEGILPALN